MAPGADLLPVRVLALNSSGGVSGPFASIAAGVGEAVAMGADVINLSIQATTDNDALRAAIEFAQDSGVIVVAAAGNKAFEGNPIVFPGAYDGVVTVGNLTASDSLSGSSSRGSAVDLVAPGSSIYSLDGSADDDYRYTSGTSMSSPFVAGVVALLLQAAPDLTLTELESVLYPTAEDLGPVGRDDGFGHGLVDPVAAFAALAELRLLPPFDLVAERDGDGTVQLDWNPHPGPTGWRVLRDGQLVAELGPEESGYGDDGAYTTVGSSYEVQAVYGTATGSAEVEVAASRAPDAPVDLVATVSDTSVELSWAGAAAASAGEPDRFEVIWNGGGFRAVTGTTTTIGGLVPETVYTFAVRERNDVGLSEPTLVEVTTLAPPPGPALSGYWMMDASGTTYAFGDAPALPGAAPAGTQSEAVALTSGAAGTGLWILRADGRVEALGTAAHHGEADLSVLTTDEKPSALSVLPDGSGYWVFTDRGRALSYGAASHHGDLVGLALNGPIVDSQATISGNGYWMLGADGGVFAFGDAEFRGSTGAMVLNEPVVGMAPDADGDGYWLVASDGGVFAFSAPFYGSMGGIVLNEPVNGMVRSGDGYLMVASDGGVFAFGPSVHFHGSLADADLAHPVIAIAPL